MGAPDVVRLNVGVIGLGKAWRSADGGYLQALLRETKRFRVLAVADQVYERAVEYSQLLRCEAAEGPTDLMEAADLDAVLLLDHQWYGLWPLEPAARMQVPIFCLPSLQADSARAEALIEQLEKSEAQVQFAFAPRFSPATRRLRRLLERRFAEVRSCRCLIEVAPAHGDGKSESAPDLTEWLDWCVTIMNGTPTRVIAAGPNECRTVHLEFEGGRAAVLELDDAGKWNRRSRAVLRTISGEVLELSFPNQVSYRVGTARIEEDWSTRSSPERRMLRAFHRLVMEGADADSGLPAARRAFELCRAIAAASAERESAPPPGCNGC